MTAEQDRIQIVAARVSNFRSLKNIEVELEDLTVLIGANNAGKSTFLDALYVALGIGRRVLGQEDIHLEPSEALPPREREVVIDVKVIPLNDDGTRADKFPRGSFWIELWGEGISQEEDTFHDFMAFRAKLAWDVAKSEYGLKKHFLKEWPEYSRWLGAEVKEDFISARQTEPISLYYIDAQRDLDEDLKRPGSFWRRLTDDLGLDEKDIKDVEDALSKLNQSLFDKSEVLQHLKENLSGLKNVVSNEAASVDISPVARRLRDLSKGVDVSFSSSGAQAFPLTRHGMGTRSLASLMVFRAFVSWRAKQSEGEDEQIHPVLALEEPEAHLHPQAQRALYSQIKAIPGQRLVSTHSPYFAGQADLSALRLFLKQGNESKARRLNLSEIDAEQKRQIERMVVATRGDLLFSRAVIFFEGETEEQAFPVFAETHWQASIHELGFNFVGIGGGHYFPFVWLANSLGIPFFIFSDGEAQPVALLKAQLGKAGIADPSKDSRVLILPSGNNFETQLISDGYQSEIELAISNTLGEKFIDEYVKKLDGKDQKGGGKRDYSSAGGRVRALLDILNGNKTTLARPLAETIAATKDQARQIPPHVKELFKRIDEALSPTTTPAKK